MRDLKRLYLIERGDNVATALGDLSAGETVAVVDATGKKTLDLQVLSDVPRFFKVAVNQLAEGQPILKWGQTIGHVPLLKKYRSEHPDISLRIDPGTVVHIANFVPLPEIAKHWGAHPIPFAASAIVELSRKMGTGGPFEIGRTRRGFSEGDPIFAREIIFDSKLGGLSLADRLLPQDSKGIQFGIALSNIAKNAPLHLGVMVASVDYLYRGERAQVEMVQSFFRFLKGRLYDLS